MAITVVYSGAIGFALALALPAFDHARYRFRKWRLERRLAHNPYMLREEYRDRILAIGEQPEPLGPLMWGAAAVALLFASGAWAADLKMEDMWEAALALLGLMLAARYLWHVLNEPDELLVEADPDNTPWVQRMWGWLGVATAVIAMWFAMDNAGWL